MLIITKTKIILILDQEIGSVFNAKTLTSLSEKNVIDVNFKPGTTTNEWTSIIKTINNITINLKKKTSLPSTALLLTNKRRAHRLRCLLFNWRVDARRLRVLGGGVRSCLAWVLWWSAFVCVRMVLRNKYIVLLHRVNKVDYSKTKVYGLTSPCHLLKTLRSTQTSLADRKTPTSYKR